MNRNRNKIKLQLFAALVLLLCFSISGLEASASSVNIDGDWVNMSPAIAPPAVFSPEMVYDSDSDRIVLFSGAISPYVVHNGTWTYDYNSNTWENVTPSISPGGRGVPAMAYDEESDRAILFGGIRKYFDNGTLLEWGDTWAYDQNSNKWENMTPDVGPHYRSIHNMVYDRESDRVILFGGFWGDATSPDGRRALSDTWAYDYNANNWTNMNPVTSPSLLYAFGMAYDSESDRVILYGGKYKSDYVSTIKLDTWAYDFNSNNWTNMYPPTNAHVRDRFQMTYHSEWDRVILFGGDAGSDTSKYDDTWAYDYNTNNWTELEPVNHPSKRYYSDLAYDDESERIILFGGCANQIDDVFNETWSLSLYGETTTTTTTTPTTTPIIEPPPPIHPIIIVIVTGSIAAVLIVLVIFLKRR